MEKENETRVPDDGDKPRRKSGHGGKRPRGRPAKLPADRALPSTRGFRLYAEDAERLQRLAVCFRKTESEVIRWALERAELSYGEDVKTDLLVCDCGEPRCMGKCSAYCDNDE